MSKALVADDPDETEGRALYRAQADATAQAQMALGRRKARLKRSASSPIGADDQRSVP